MKIKKILSIVLFVLPFISYSQQFVDNISWEFSDLKMTVTYDLNSSDGISRTYDINMEVIIGDEVIRPNKGIIGINQQRNGKGKKIEWYFTRSGKTESELNVDGLQVIVKATNPNPPIATKTDPIIKETPSSPSPSPIVKKGNGNGPSLLLPVVTTSAGLGIVVAGLVQEGKAKDLYDIYKAHTVESAQREIDYQLANDKHKNAQFVTIAGGVIVGASTYWLFRNLKKRKNNNGLTVVPAVEDAPLYGVYSGVGVRFSF